MQSDPLRGPPGKRAPAGCQAPALPGLPERTARPGANRRHRFRIGAMSQAAHEGEPKVANATATRPTLLHPVRLRQLVDDERERLAELVTVDVTSAADLHALAPRTAHDPEGLVLSDGSPVPPEVLAAMEAEADRVVKAAPPMSEPTRARLRELLGLAATMRRPPVHHDDAGHASPVPANPAT